MTQAQDLDLIVLGGGPGGYVAAIWAAKLGLRTTLVEEKHLGGICLNWGCIPTKALLRNAEVMDLVRRGKDWGIQIPSYEVQWSAVIRRSRQVANRLTKGVEFLLKKNKITHVPGRGRLTGPGEVEVVDSDGGTQKLRARAIVVATGGRARQLPCAPFDGERIITSHEAMILKEIPGRLLIIGAGAIGVEFGQIYGDFGSEITLVELLPRVLPLEDEEVSAELERIFKRRGWKILTDSKVTSLERHEKEVVCQVEHDGASREVRADVVLVAVGVQGNVEDIGLETVGVEAERGFIKVGPHMETNIPGIYAIGDVAGPPLLAHAASAEGMTAVSHFAGKNPSPVDHTYTPGCTYCRPQVASLGLTESQAREKGHSIRVGRFPFRANGRALGHGDYEGFVKVIFGEAHGEILGAHIVGPEATEILGELGLAASSELTHNEILGTIHAHPTLSEALAEATGAAFDEAIHI
jgi:dihydrolipoamide dehydrogenase